MAIKYTKSIYLAKISELEGYKAQLATHLDNMIRLKDEMFRFWNDPTAREVSEALLQQIRQTKSTMDWTTELITVYKKAVERFNGIESHDMDLIKNVLGLLKGSGT